MLRALAIQGIAAAILANLGCTVFATVVLHNHAGAPVVVRSGSGDRTRERVVPPDGRVELDGRTLSIVREGVEWRYAYVEDPPQGLIETSRWRPRRAFHVQI